MRTRNVLTIVLAIAMVLVPITTAQADVVYNLYVGQASVPAGTSAMAPDASDVKHWNKPTEDGMHVPWPDESGNLLNSDGVDDGVDWFMDSQGEKAVAGSKGSGIALLTSYLIGQPGSTVDPTFVMPITGLDDGYAYDLYVYSNCNWGSFDTRFGVTTGTLSGVSEAYINSTSNSASYVLADAANDATNPGENYFVFEGITPVSGEIAFEWGCAPGTNRPVFTGFQLHGVPTSESTMMWRTDSPGDGYWHEANWSDDGGMPLVLPIADMEMIVNSGTATVSTDVSATAAKSLEIARDNASGTVQIASTGTLAVTDDVNIGDGGALNINGVLSTGALTAGGIVQIASTGTLAVTTDVNVGDGGALDVNGALSTGALTAGGTVQIASTGTLAVTADVDVGDGGTLDVNGALSTGGLNADVGSSINAVGGSVTATNFTNNGGTIVFDAASSLTVSTITQTAGMTTLTAGATVSSVTDLTVTGGVLDTVGVNVSNTATIGEHVVATSDGTHAFDVSGSDVLDAHTLTINGGTLTLAGHYMPATTGEEAIGVNLGSNQSAMAATDTAGAVASYANWNNAPDREGTTADIVGPTAGKLVTSEGADSGVSVAWDNSSANSTWYTSNSGNGDEIMMNGYIGLGNTAPPGVTVTFTNMTQFASEYAVYAYFGSGHNSAVGTISNGDTTYGVKANSAGVEFPSGYVAATVLSSEDQTTWTDANYAVFSGMTGDEFTITYAKIGSNAGMHGIQIVDLTGLATAGVIDLSNTTIATTENSTALITDQAGTLLLGGVAPAADTTLTIDSSAATINMTNMTLGGGSMVLSSASTSGASDVTMTVSGMLTGGDSVADIGEMPAVLPEEINGDSGAINLTLTGTSTYEWTFVEGVDTHIDVTGMITMEAGATINLNLGSGSISDGTVRLFRSYLDEFNIGGVTYDPDDPGDLSLADISITTSAGMVLEEGFTLAWSEYIEDPNMDGEEFIYLTLTGVSTGLVVEDQEGDATGDLAVDEADMAVLLAQFGSEYDTTLTADFNGDGYVDIADFVILRANWGAGTTPPSASELPSTTPEPATMTMLALGGLMALRRRRRK
jgi:hypothetical protein